MPYPNGPEWSALQNRIITNEDGKIELSTVACGKLKLPSGQLMVCDPFAAMSKSGNAFIQIKPGEYEVIVTVADVSADLDGSHFREAYASLILDETQAESTRQPLELTLTEEPSQQPLQDGEFYGYGVDAGTACFADAQTIKSDMPDEDTWYDDLFESENRDSWFDQMDDEKLIRRGIANIRLPLTNSDNNLILFHSGWGDGFYPVVGGYSADGTLIAIHTDFHVVELSEYEDEDEDEDKDETTDSATQPLVTESSVNAEVMTRETKPWWKFWS
ncbi:hypothetical protein GCM10009111_15350 [Colwellia asteriadis]|uniref:DUF4241 domain-containing protein n=1 Tax=Colwellia asteriadis TaxID=517723 RepID=A0ABN1L651_9GAMM